MVQAVMEKWGAAAPLPLMGWGGNPCFIGPSGTKEVSVGRTGQYHKQF